MEELLKLHPKLFKIVNILDQSVHGAVKHTNFWNSTKNHTHTITVIKSNNGSIFGAYCPKKWENF